MIKSMTAFARCQKQGDWGSLVWEVRSVNSRYLDTFVRLPESLREIEMKVRDVVKTQLTRGKVECALRFHAGPGLVQTFNLNHGLIQQLKVASEEIGQAFAVRDTVSAFDVLRWPDVVMAGEADLSEVQKQAISLLSEALIELNMVRDREGQGIKTFMLERLTAMSHEVAKVEGRIEAIITTQKQRLIDKVSELKVEIDPNRLEQEMVFWAQKLDVNEELQRLHSHIKEVTSIVKKGGVVGRKLDFLMQELNREANTLGAKSSDVETTQVSVALKVLIEQVREQVQNLE